MATAPPRTLAPNASLPAKVVPAQPNQTLYIRGLPSSKVRKDDLRTALYLLFSTYGPVLDVVALKANGMRGQAHIVYRDIATAAQAMRSLEGTEFLGSPLKIEYARGRSHIISKLEGSFKAQASGAAAVEVTQLQQSIFNAPGPSAPGAAPSATALPPRPPAAGPEPEGGQPGGASGSAAAGDGRGQKRPRDEADEDDDSDVAMEEDSDEE